MLTKRPCDDSHRSQISLLRWVIGREQKWSISGERRSVVEPWSSEVTIRCHPILYGSVLQGLGQTEESLTHLQRAVTLEPRFGMAWLSLGWSLATVAWSGEALYALGRAKALENRAGLGSVAGVGGSIADCLRCEGRFEEARIEALAGARVG